MLSFLLDFRGQSQSCHSVSQALKGPYCVNSLIHHAFQEQMKMKLSWYVTWKQISRQQQHTPTQSSYSLDFHCNLFNFQWQTNLSKQNKMALYKQIKHSFGKEAYLGLQNRSHRLHIAQIRSSSHDLKIFYKGRHSGNYADPTCIVCSFCCNDSDCTMTIFLNLPFCEHSYSKLKSTL